MLWAVERGTLVWVVMVVEVYGNGEDGDGGRTA